MLVLGIETSCDETAVALVEDGTTVRSNVIGTQFEHHRPFGGVVPEIAARAHLDMMLPAIDRAFVEAGATYADVEGVAVTAGPGLVGALLVGVAAAKSIALAHDLPFIGVNHLEGHVCATQLEFGHLEPPMISLIVSGGHTSLVLLDAEGRFETIGQTIDDAAGEAFDKIARFMGLPFPGGPEIDKLGRTGDPTAIAFPRAMMNDGTLDFSMSGLKTAVIRELRRREAVGEEIVMPDVAASFNEAIVDVLVTKTLRAAEAHDVGTITLVGGVAANGRLREAMADGCARTDRRLLLPQPVLCTDNGAMIAAAGYRHFKDDIQTEWGLDVIPNLSL